MKKTRNPIAKAVTRIRPKIVPHKKRKILLENRTTVTVSREERDEKR